MDPALRARMESRRLSNRTRAGGGAKAGLDPKAEQDGGVWVEDLGRKGEEGEGKGRNGEERGGMDGEGWMGRKGEWMERKGDGWRRKGMDGDEVAAVLGSPSPAPPQGSSAPAPGGGDASVFRFEVFSLEWETVQHHTKEGWGSRGGAVPRGASACYGKRQASATRRVQQGPKPLLLSTRVHPWATRRMLMAQKSQNTTGLMGTTPASGPLPRPGHGSAAPH